jgi:hypothetical protein
MTDYNLFANEALTELSIHLGERRFLRPKHVRCEVCEEYQLFAKEQLYFSDLLPYLLQKCIQFVTK